MVNRENKTDLRRRTKEEEEANYKRKKEEEEEEESDTKEEEESRGKKGRGKKKEEENKKKKTTNNEQKQEEEEEMNEEAGTGDEERKEETEDGVKEEKKEVQENGEAGDKREYDEKEIRPDTYWLTRIIFLRALAFIYFVAFRVAYDQNKQLIGDTGLLPLQLHMKAIVNITGGNWVGNFVAAPTLLWCAEPWDTVNPWLDNIALAGMTLAGTVFILGSANVFIMLALWFLYFSLVSVGQSWYGFGWESQLLETGLLSAWSVPLLSLSQLPSSSPPTPILVWGLRWLIFRIMLGAGLIKLRGDWCWWTLTCMFYHYETQPVPNPLSYYLHQSPGIIHYLETLGNHIIELVLPIFTFMIRELRMVCGVAQMLFQVVLILSGNFSFLNWLTMVPSVAYFDDRTYSVFFTSGTKEKVRHLQKLEREGSPLVDPGSARRTWNKIIGTLMAVLSVPVVINLLSASQVMNTSFEPFRIVNTYGAFGSVHQERNEVILEGTHSRDPKNNRTIWLEYEFKCKPGRLDKQPCFISPYHYRLDWLMWFAALQSFEQHPWLLHLVGKMLINDEEATTLLAHNPFIDTKPPLFIRATRYRYQYTSINNLTRDWYERKEEGPYLPPLNINTLKLIFRRLKWKTLVGAVQG